MKIKHQPGYGKRISVLTMETDRERALSNSELLALCENVRGIAYNPKTGSYELTGSSFGPQPAFGGSVERNGNNVRVIGHTNS